MKDIKTDIVVQLRAVDSSDVEELCQYAATYIEVLRDELIVTAQAAGIIP